MSASDPDMAALRQKIDALDDALVDLLAQRQRCIEEAARIKPRIGWPARIPARVDQVIDRVSARAKSKKFDPDLARKLWTALVDWSIAYEDRLMDNGPEKNSDHS